MAKKLTKEQLEARFEALSEAEDHCIAMAEDCDNAVLHEAYIWVGKKLEAEELKTLKKIEALKRT